MFKRLVSKVVGDPTQKYLNSLLPTVDGVAELESLSQFCEANPVRVIDAPLCVVLLPEYLDKSFHGYHSVFLLS